MPKKLKLNGSMMIYRPPRSNTKKSCPFHHRALECKSRKSIDTWSNRQVWPWSIEWSRAKSNRILWRERTSHSKHPLPTTQRWLYTWTSPEGQHWSQIDYILCSWRWRSYTQAVKTRPGADCGSDHELLRVKFRLKLKKEGKTTRLFIYDLNQISYDYTVEVTNRFKGLDLIECLKNTNGVSWHCTGAEIKTIPEKKKGKMAVWGGLTNSWEKKRSKR